MKKVSIIIPVYNGANYLAEAINSALNQTYSNIEVIVVNDGSKDGGATEKIALSFGNKIKYIHQENGGVSSALNTGIEAANSEWISWLSHDDLYTPKKIENQIKHLSEIQDDGKTIIMCGSSDINRNGETLLPNRIRDIKVKKYNNLEMLNLIFTSLSINGCCLLLKKKWLKECGMFEDYRYLQDIQCWFKLFLNGYSLVYSNDKDVQRRVHSQQTTQTGKDLFYKERIEVGKFFIDNLLSRSEYKKSLRKYIDYCNSHGNREVLDYLSTRTTKYNCYIRFSKLKSLPRFILHKLFQRFLNYQRK